MRFGKEVLPVGEKLWSLAELGSEGMNEIGNKTGVVIVCLTKMVSYYMGGELTDLKIRKEKRFKKLIDTLKAKNKNPFSLIS